MLVQRFRADIGAGGHDPCHLSLYQSFGKTRILNLLADGNAVPLFHELCYINVYGVKRDAAHRCPFVQSAGFSGQRQLQLLRGNLRIIKKHFIEIAKPVKQKALRVLLLGAQVFLHHR